MGRTFAIIYQVCVWEQKIINIVPPNDSRLIVFYRWLWSSLSLTSNHAFYFVLFSNVLCIDRPTVIKIAASHDFLGGLAALIFTTGSRLATIFTAWLQLPWSSQKSQYLYCRVSSPADTAGAHVHKQNLGLLESCVMFCRCLPWRFINWCEKVWFLYSGCHHQRVIAFLMYWNACSTGLARA